MAVIVQDSFTDSNGTLLENHTPEIGGVWTKDFGTNSLEIIDNVCKGDASNFARYINDTVASDVEVTQDSDEQAPSHAVGAYIYLRFTDSSNYYYFIPGNGIWKLVGGSATKLKDTPSGGSGVSTIIFKAEGTLLTAEVSGSGPWSVNDSDLASGKIGFGVRDNVDVDNFSASSIVPVGNIFAGINKSNINGGGLIV